MTLVLCMIPAAALDGETVPGWDGLWDQAEDYGVTRDTGLEGGLSQLAAQGLEQLKELAGRSVATGVKLLAVVLVCGLAQSAALPGQQEGVRAAELAGALAITALTMTDVAAMIGLGRETLRRMDDFSQALLPVMAALTAATGRVSGAAVGQGVTVLFSQLLLDAMDGLLIPLIDGYVAVSCAWAAVDSPGLKKLGELMKGAAALILTGLLLCGLSHRQRGHCRQCGCRRRENGQAGHLPGHPRSGGHFGRCLGDGAGRGGCAAGHGGGGGDAGGAGHLPDPLPPPGTALSGV